MNGTQAALLAREYFDGLQTTCPDVLFETIDISQFDFNEFEVTCRVFTCSCCGMTDYKVVISDGKVESVKECPAVGE